jgi:hypothetical protein
MIQSRWFPFPFRQCSLIKTLFLSGLIILPPATLVASGVYDVRDFGAKGDGQTFDTVAIQSAIDKASNAGGGKVVLPPGTYLSGSLHLKSHTELFIDKEATLLGSASLSDYVRGERHMSQPVNGQQDLINQSVANAPRYALLLADGQEDVTLSGEGTINGQGRALALDVMRRIEAGEITTPQKHKNMPNEVDRPSIISFGGCRNVKVTGVTLLDASCWTEIYGNCEDLTVEGIHVDSRKYWNADGIDIVDCKRVRVSHCDFDSEDDGVCLKSELGGPGCYDVDVSDCRIRSRVQNALKLGTASNAGFRKIHANNLTVDNTRRSAIALECVDGGVLKDVLVENVHGTNTGNAIFLRLGHRNTDGPVGELQDVVIRNVNVEITTNLSRAYPEINLPPPVLTALTSAASPPSKPIEDICPSLIVGLPGYPVRNVRLENITIIYQGADVPYPNCLLPAQLDMVPELPPQYPEFWMFGEMPAWGFYMRHAEGIQFSNVKLVLQEADLRAAVVFDDVTRVRAEQLTISAAPHEPALVMQNVKDASFKNSNFPAAGPGAVKMQGNCKKIKGLQPSL